MGLYLAVIGWTTLLIIADVIVIAVVIWVMMFFAGKPGGANSMLVFLRQHPYLALHTNIANYLALVLCIGVVMRVYLTHGVWERVVTSVTAHNLDLADNVKVRGALASALGEGFADSLDVAGF